jgi:nucleoside-diphosphate-sugar epimerase
MLTGGTGFLGGHTAAALVAGGHQPHFLVRDSTKFEQACVLHDLDPAVVSFTVGDVRDEGAVLAALDQCQACIHAAAVAVSRVETADTTTVQSINNVGARTVLDHAVSAGCDPVIQVSSMAVLAPSSDQLLSADGPVRESGDRYTAAKADAELYARALQADGKAVVIVYPGAIAGPKDLGVNGFEATVAHWLEATVHFRLPTGGILIVDVRDLAAALTRLLDTSRGPRRYTAGGHLLNWDQWAAALDSASGAHRPLVDITADETITRFGKGIAHYWMELQPSDDGPLQRDSGITWRPPTETLTDLLSWMASRTA